MVGSFFLRTLSHGEFEDSINLINHCTKNYNPASNFVKIVNHKRLSVSATIAMPKL